MIKTLLTLLFLFTHCFAEAEASIEEQKIQFLLDSVEKSEVIFIRNAKEHTAAEARKHLENKMNYARRAFWLFGPKVDITVENFITKIASSSSTSKKEYQVKLKDGTLMKTSLWLRQRLKDFKQNSPVPSKK